MSQLQGGHFPKSVVASVRIVITSIRFQGPSHCQLRHYPISVQRTRNAGVVVGESLSGLMNEPN